MFCCSVKHFELHWCMKCTVQIKLALTVPTTWLLRVCFVLFFVCTFFSAIFFRPESCRLCWQFLINILTAFWVQIQETYLTTHHGDPFTEGASSDPSEESEAILSEFCCLTSVVVTEVGKSFPGIYFYPSRALTSYLRVNVSKLE